MNDPVRSASPVVEASAPEPNPTADDLEKLRQDPTLGFCPVCGAVMHPPRMLAAIIGAIALIAAIPLLVAIFRALFNYSPPPITGMFFLGALAGAGAMVRDAWNKVCPKCHRAKLIRPERR